MLDRHLAHRDSIRMSTEPDADTASLSRHIPEGCLRAMSFNSHVIRSRGQGESEVGSALVQTLKMGREIFGTCPSLRRKVSIRSNGSLALWMNRRLLCHSSHSPSARASIVMPLPVPHLARPSRTSTVRMGTLKVAARPAERRRGPPQ